MGEQKYEYTAVRVNKLVPNETTYTERLNSVAAHGWRLVTLSPDKNHNDLLVFERPIND